MTKKLPLCECGCGEPVTKLGNRFITGHNLRCFSEEIKLKRDKSAKSRPPISEKTRKKMSDAAKSRSAPSEEALENMCKAQYGRNQGKNNPMFGKIGKNSPNYGKKHKPETIKKMSETAMGENNPMFGRFGEDNPMYGIPRPDELRKRLSDANIDNPKLSGNSIIKHHYIYDHSHPELYTMEVTRSKHMQIHGWMRRSGIKVPHINITEENKDIFGVKYEQ